MVEEMKEQECPKCLQQVVPRKVQISDERVVGKCPACDIVLVW